MPEDENKVAYQVLDLIRAQNRDGSLFLSREDALYFLNRYGDLRASEWWMDGDDCGSPECLRAAREAYRQEREEAHEQLDKDMGYY